MKWLLAGLVMLTSILLTLHSAEAAHPFASADTYTRTVHHLRVRLDTDARAPLSHVPDVRRIQSDLRRLGTVDLPDGTISTDTFRIAAEIDPRDEASIRHAAAELDALDAGLAAASNGGVESNGAEGALLAVYADPRFHHPCSGSTCVQQWILDHFGDPLQRLLVWLVDHRPRTISINPAVAALSLLLFAALVAGFGFLLASGALRRATAQAQLRREVPHDVPEADVEELARAASAAQDLRTAFRYVFLSLMLELQSRGLVQLRPGWTNRDHLRSIVRAGAPLAAPLGELVDAFDQVWYGGVDLRQAEYERLLALAHKIRYAQVTAA